MIRASMDRRGKFYAVNKKSKTAAIIYNSLATILGYPRKGGSKPMFRSIFTSRLDKLVKAVWEEQEKIGWEQIMYGRISSKWGQAQSLFYDSNPDTRLVKHFTREVWVHKTIGSFLLHTEGLWNDRCDCMHGATEEENKKILKSKAVAKVMKLYEGKDNIQEGFGYMFQNP